MAESNRHTDPDTSHGARPRLARGTLQVLASEGLALPTGMILAAVVARTLGPGGYGVFALAVSMTATAEWLIGALFSRATITIVGGSGERPPASAVLRWHLLVGGAAGIGFWLAAERLAGAMQEPAIKTCLRLLAFEVPLVALSGGCRSILTGHGRFGARAIAGAVRWVARLACVGTLVALGFSISGAAAGSVIAAAITLAVALLFVRPLIESGPARLPAGFWRVALPAFLLAMSLRLLDKVGLVALKSFGATTADVGWYAAAQNFSIAPGLFVISFSPLLLSTLTRLLHDGHTDDARALGRDALRLTVLGAPILAMAAGSASEVVGLVYGSGFLPAAPLATPFLAAAFSVAGISVASALLTALGRAREAGRSTWPILPVALVGYAMVVPRWGAMGAAMVTALAATIGATLSLRSVYRAWQVAPPLSSAARSMVVTIGSYVVAMAWPTPGGWWFLKVAVMVPAIGAAYLVLGEWTRDEVSRITRFVAMSVRRTDH